VKDFPGTLTVGAQGIIGRPVGQAGNHFLFLIAHCYLTSKRNSGHRKVR
jgi:hypothetical protein